MRIALLGDLHGDFAPARGLGDVDALILLGDQTPERPLDEELGPELAARTWFLLGNHDGEPAWLERHLPLWERRLHARVHDFGGMRIAGLGGAFRGKIWMPPHTPRHHSRAELAEATAPWRRWNHGPAPRHWASIFPNDMETLREQSADVLVTHEAPESHRHGFTAIGELARDMGVRLIVHGHTHAPYEAALDHGAEAGVGIHVVGLAPGEPYFLDA